MTLDEKLAKAQAMIEHAIKKYSPKRIFALFSGGHDSGSVTDFTAAALGSDLDGVVHINTGIGIEETRQYVRETCERRCWNLCEYKATENTKADGTPDPMIYEDIVMSHGFPGAFGHGMMYTRLKERQLRRLARDHNATSAEPIMLISGCRKEESIRRMGTVKGIDKTGRFLWVNPFEDMTALDCSEYMARVEMPRNPVKDLIHMSGECLCGAYAHPGELAEIELWYPDTAAEIRRIERKVREAGFPWGWEEQPPPWWKKRKQAAKAGQQDAFEEEAIAEIQYLCVSCTKREEEAMP
jgi:3'-phosphoadenosine 5'-phosphosulfate sulfotransferase (PAPS reductase)/FAD synthetase